MIIITLISQKSQPFAYQGEKLEALDKFLNCYFLSNINYKYHKQNYKSFLKIINCSYNDFRDIPSGHIKHNINRRQIDNTTTLAQFGDIWRSLM